jgi:hypothetical protein
VSATASAVLNTLSAMDIVGTIHSAGLPTPNPIDVTAAKCGKLGCVGEVDSDTVSILKFDHSGAAQRYAATISNSYQIEDIVLMFRCHGVGKPEAGLRTRGAARCRVSSRFPRNPVSGPRPRGAGRSAMPR